MQDPTRSPTSAELLAAIIHAQTLCLSWLPSQPDLDRAACVCAHLDHAREALEIAERQ